MKELEKGEFAVVQKGPEGKPLMVFRGMLANSLDIYLSRLIVKARQRAGLDSYVVADREDYKKWKRGELDEPTEREAESTSQERPQDD